MSEEERRFTPVSDEPVADERDFEAHRLEEEKKEALTDEEKARRRAKEEEEADVEGHMPIQDRPVQDRPVAE